MIPSRSSLFCAIIFATLLLGACDQRGPTGLWVEDIEFKESELRGLSADHRLRLGELTAFGLAVAQGELSTVTASVQRAFEEARIVDYATAERILEQASMSDDDLRAEYSLDPAYELTVRHLIVLSPRWEDEATRDAAREKASGALDRIRAGEAFPVVAAEISEEPGAEGRQGLLEPGRQGAWVGEFWSAAVSLDVGAVSPVVETQYGFHVLRLEDKATVPFAQARPGVAMQVAQRERGVLGALQAWTDSLETEVTVDDEAWAAWTAGDAAPGTVVARRGSHALTSERLDAVLAGLGNDAIQTARLQAGRPLIRRLAALQVALSYAREIGVELPAEEMATIERNIEQSTTRWAAAFGFVPGMSEAQVKETARAAYSAARQGATMARGELTLLAPGLREHYAIYLGAR